MATQRNETTADVTGWGSGQETQGWDWRFARVRVKDIPRTI
jgi:hypothetical protein